MSDTPPIPAPPIPGPPTAAPPGRIGPPARKLGGVAVILLLLLVPHWLIGGLIEERQARQAEVVREIGRSWGQQQTLSGPVLLLPYRVPVESSGPPAWRRGTLLVLPQHLAADVELTPETRRRGLFGAVVYGAGIGLSGSFNLTALTPPDSPEAEFLWREAQVMLGSGDLRLAGAGAPLRWDGRVVEPGEAGADPALDRSLCAPADSLRWPLGLEGPPVAATAFDLRLELRGSGSFRLAPLARRVRMEMRGPWPTPSFTGSDLPSSSTLSAGGFTAAWDAGTRQPLLRRSLCAGAEAIGVELLEAVPTYRMVSRASKYVMFFLALAFITYGIFEMVARVRIHPLQYGLLGASVVLFPLLLLALGEPLGFTPAYAAAAALVAAQASLYTAAATRRARLGAVLALVFAALFGFLYVVLSLESYALLVGALALFAALSLVMAVSRRVEWGEG
jgi:inner membrane protein